MTTDLDLVLTEDLVAALRQRAECGIVVLVAQRTSDESEIFSQSWGKLLTVVGLAEVVKATSVNQLMPPVTTDPEDQDTA